jgi:Linalool dehydratase/isomerase
MQSYLQLKKRSPIHVIGEMIGVPGAITYARHMRLWRLYALLCVAALLLQTLIRSPQTVAIAAGLAVPAAGFLHWTPSADGEAFLLPALVIVAFGLFGLSLIIWFGTGNIILPPVIWLGLAILSGFPEMFGLAFQLNGAAGQMGVILPLLLPLGLIAALSIRGQRQTDMQAAPTSDLPQQITGTVPRQEVSEISLDDLKRMRLLFDRALQPVDQFSGFEWRDQFQTAAVRYQLNFLSYAISMAQHHYLPAATAYVTRAQDNLLAKQGDERIWKYWRYENAWGKLRLGRDPVPSDNIMYTGFIAAQMSYANQASNNSALCLIRRDKEYRRYDLDALCALLSSQYRSAPYGLLACEPNWIYPLCNMITATALRAHSVRESTGDWDEIAPTFRKGLIEEFTNEKGRFVSFRSSVTGIAPPSLGGSVMQAFPSFFLNSLFPDLAQQQWEILRNDLRGRNWKQQFWPIDVGNYGFSRASSYAASAAAAVEMGDGETAERLLALLEDACPTQSLSNVFHRDKASLWAHAAEMIARMGRHNGLARINSSPPLSAKTGPHIEYAPYPDVMIASAKRLGINGLHLILYPGSKATDASIRVAGLMPERHYRTGLCNMPFVQTDRTGCASLTLRIAGRLCLNFVPVI